MHSPTGGKDGEKRWRSVVTPSQRRFQWIPCLHSAASSRTAVVVFADLRTRLAERRGGREGQGARGFQ